MKFQNNLLRLFVFLCGTLGFLFLSSKPSFAVVKTWNPAGCASNSWNTAGNWSGGIPGTGDVATFNGSTSNCPVTMDTNPDVGGINIINSYTGTITQGTRNLTIEGSGYTQNAASSIFAGGSGSITFNNNSGNFTLTSGTFTSTTGTLKVLNNFSISGTFNANNGTVDFDSTGASGQVSGTFTLNNATFGGSCNNETTILTGTAILTVNGTLKLDNANCADHKLDGTSGTLNAKGDITIASTSNSGNFGGSATITINGTGTQTFTGNTQSSYGQGSPGLVINKSSGTLSFANFIPLDGDLTFIQGSLDFGTSTIAIRSQRDQADYSATITGNMSFYNLAFGMVCSGNRDITIQSGTTLTVTHTFMTSNDGCNNIRIKGNGNMILTGDIDLSQLATTNPIVGSVSATLTGPGTHTITGASDTGSGGGLPGLTINTTGTVNLSGNIGIASNFTYVHGTINPGTSTVIFNGIGDDDGGHNDATLTGTMYLNNIDISNSCSGGYTITVASGTTLTALGDLNLNEVCFAGLVNGPGTINVQGNLTSTSQGEAGDVAVTLNGLKDQTVTLNGSSGPSGTVTIDKTAGTVSLGSDVNIGNSGQDLVIANGVLNIGTHNLTVNDVLTITSGQLNQTTGALSFGTMSIGSKGIWENNSTGGVTVGSGGVSNSGYVHLDGGGPTCGDAIAGGTISNNAGFVQTQNNTGGSTTSLSKAFDSSNTAGDLIVVTVDWDGSATPSVSDSRNTYHTAVGPTTGTFGKEETFYAYNIGAGANTVNVTFSPATTSFSLLYIFEYSGIVSASDPYDNSVGAAGSGTTMDSTSASTGNANDLIYGAGLAEATGGSAGSGFTSRNSNYGNQYEDKKVTSTGSYNATAGNDGNHYIMQMVAFKAQTSVGFSAPLAIVSSSPGTARTWSGSGTYVLNDLNVTDQNGSLTAYDSNNSSSGWTFVNGCPAYSNRSSSKITGGSKVTGGTTIRSN